MRIVDKVTVVESRFAAPGNGIELQGESRPSTNRAEKHDRSYTDVNLGIYHDSVGIGFKSDYAYPSGASRKHSGGIHIPLEDLETLTQIKDFIDKAINESIVFSAGDDALTILRSGEKLTPLGTLAIERLEHLGQLTFDDRVALAKLREES